MRFFRMLGYAVLSVVTLFPLPGRPEQPSKSSTAQFSPIWRDQRLTVVAENVAIAEVMKSISGKTGLEIKGVEFLKGNVHAQFSNLPLAIALKELLPSANYLLQEPAGPGKLHPILTVLSFSGTDLAKATQSSALKKTGGPIGIPASAGYVSKEYRKLYGYAAEGNLTALQDAVDNGGSAEQAIAAQLLVQKDPALASEIAAENIKSQDSNKRLTSIQALSDIDNLTSTNALGTALEDPDFSVRSAAVMGLHNQTSKTAVTYLTQALQDEDASIRLLALDLLAEKGTDGIAGINEAMVSTDQQLKEHAQALLKQINPDESH